MSTNRRSTTTCPLFSDARKGPVHPAGYVVLIARVLLMCTVADHFLHKLVNKCQVEVRPVSTYLRT